jgi:hypothetical protein
MQMNIPASFGPICFSGSLEEDWNVYGRTTSDGNTHMTLRVRWAKNGLIGGVDSLEGDNLK